MTIWPANLPVDGLGQIGVAVPRRHRRGAGVHTLSQSSGRRSGRGLLREFLDFCTKINISKTPTTRLIFSWRENQTGHRVARIRQVGSPEVALPIAGRVAIRPVGQQEVQLVEQE